MKKYLKNNKNLMKEWDWEKNNMLGLDPSEITEGSSKMAWWLCLNKHNYECRISNKTILNRGCPYCSRKKAIRGVNDFATMYPDIAEEWDYDKNDKLLPNDLLPHSNKKVWWKCKRCGNSWQQNCNHRTSRNRGCPYCSGRVAITNVNDLMTINPKLASEWNYEKNNGLTPKNVKSNSKKKVWWKCKKGHEWSTQISNRTNGTNCPYCSNKKVLVGFNDLKTVNSQLAEEWNYEKNGTLLPENVLPGSHKKVWWKCRKGHEYFSSISNRTRKKYKCPICSSQKLLKGYNDLETVAPRLASEWDYEKNNGLLPSDIFPNSNKKIWWKCRKGHVWESTPNDRSQGNGCPMCSAELNTSFPEQCIYFYLSKLTKAENRSKLFGKEIDVYLPDLNIGIEYNGKFYHKNKENLDKAKKKFLQERGIKIIALQESLSNYIEEDVIYYMYNNRNKHNLEWAIKKIVQLLGYKEDYLDIDINRDSINIYEQYIKLEKENSLANKNPILAQEWHPQKNGELTAEMVSCQSNIKVWWLGKCGHEWISDVAHRDSGRGCPYCSNKKILVGFNDLKTINSRLAEEWNYEKNGKLLPENVLPGSQKKVWWNCKKGHEWQAAIYSRNNGNNCPFCSGRKKITGVNDFSTLHPKLAELWNYKKNILKPNDVSSHSHKSVYWKCSVCECEWKAEIRNVVRGKGCPNCYKLKQKNNER